MYKVIVNNQCNCFKKSELEVHSEFENEEDALNFALKMNKIMNNEFCKKHSFQVLKVFDTFSISLAKPLEKALKCCGSGCCK